MKLSIIRDFSKRFSPPTTQEELQQILDTLRSEGIDFQNFYQELEMSEPQVETHRDVTYSNAQLNLHSHVFYELLFCCNDCGAEYLVGADRYRLRRGDIVFVPPGISHRPLLPETLTYSYERYVLRLSQDFVDEFIQTNDMRVVAHSDGYCFINNKGLDKALCRTDGIGLDPIKRTDSLCLKCPNFAIDNSRKAHWERRIKLHQDVIDSSKNKKLVESSKIFISQAEKMLNSIQLAEKSKVTS